MILLNYWDDKVLVLRMSHYCGMQMFDLRVSTQALEILFVVHLFLNVSLASAKELRQSISLWCIMYIYIIAFRNNCDMFSRVLLMKDQMSPGMH